MADFSVEVLRLVLATNPCMVVACMVPVRVMRTSSCTHLLLAGIDQDTYNTKYASKTAAALANITGVPVKDIGYNSTTVLNMPPPPPPEEKEEEPAAKPAAVAKEAAPAAEPAEAAEPKEAGGCCHRCIIVRRNACAMSHPSAS
jgi:uncharacterized membrane protein